MTVLAFDRAWVEQPSLLIPGRRPVSLAGLKAKREVFGGGILKALLVGKYDLIQRGLWTGGGSDIGKAFQVAAGGTVTAPRAFTVQSANCGLAFVFRMRPASVVNYDPFIATGNWGGNYVIHSDSAGGVYAGWSTSSRVSPAQSGNGVFVANQTNDFVVWYGVYTAGSTYGVRLYKNRSLIVNHELAAPGFPTQTPGSLYVSATGSCDIEYLAAIDFGENWQGASNDAGFTNVVNKIQFDPYNELLELA